MDKNYSLNREVIAYTRIEGSTDKRAAAHFPTLFEYVLARGEETIDTIVYEDAGQCLKDFVLKERLFDAVRYLLIPVLEALKFLCELGIVHGDVHFGNICLRLDSAGALKPKLIDLGNSDVISCSRTWTADEYGHWIDPVTRLTSDQTLAPVAGAREVMLTWAKNSCFFRDPKGLALDALRCCAEIDSESHPWGAWFGCTDNIYGLAMCVALVMTGESYETVREAGLCSDRSIGRAKRLSAFENTLRFNPACSSDLLSGFFDKLDWKHCRLSARRLARIDEAAKALEERATRSEAKYPEFFEEVLCLYGRETCDLVYSCFQPRRESRLRWISGRQKGTRYVPAKGDHCDRSVRATTSTREKGEKSQKEHAMHVFLGSCWMMTGCVRGECVIWWSATRKTIENRNIFALQAVARFVEAVRECHEPLAEMSPENWTFRHDFQRSQWMQALRNYRNRSVV